MHWIIHSPGSAQMMAALEEELEVQLFARAKKGVALTDNGIRLLPYIRDMVNQKEKLMQAAFNINKQNRRKATHWMFYQCDGHVDAGRDPLFQREFSSGRGADP